MLTAADKRAMLDEIAEAANILSPIQDDEFTAKELAEAANCSYATAVRGLVQLVEEGVVTRRKAAVNGKAGWAYRYVEEHD